MIAMIRTLTVLLLLVASGLNTATASSAFCPDFPESATLSCPDSVNSTLQDLDGVVSHRDTSTDEHSSSATHHCHFGHCQYLISTTSDFSPLFNTYGFFFVVEQLDGVAQREFHRPPCS